MGFLEIARTGRSETEVKNSRFLGEACAVHSEEEALQRIAGLKKEHYDARHVCSAYIIRRDEGGVPIVRASDDGEPQGTAGRPILSVIEGSGLQNCLITVVRYFGGVKLGAGGLIRAYSGAVADALAHAKKSEEILLDEWKITYPYDLSGTVENWLRRNTDIQDIAYDEQVSCTFISEDDNIEKQIRDLSKGTVIPEFVDTVLLEKDV